MKSESTQAKTWLLVCSLVCVLGLGMGGYQFVKFLGSPLPTKLNYVPDDAFYYFQVCLTKAGKGLWSFDGATPTTGFHLLFGFMLLTVIELFHMSDVELIIAVVSLCFLFFWFSCIPVFLIARRVLDRNYGLLLTGLWAGNFYNIRGALTGLEFGLVLLVTTLFFLTLMGFVTADFAKQGRRRGICVLILVAALSYLLCLTRIDLALMSAAFASVFFVWGLSVKPREVVAPLGRAGFAMLVGTALGALSISLFCLSVTGKLVQDSGRIKLVWTQVAAMEKMTSRYDPVVMAENFVRITGNFLRYTVFVFFEPLALVSVGIPAILVAGALWRRKKRLADVPLAEPMTLLAIGSACHIVLTLFYYAFTYSAGFRPQWYYAKLIFSLGFLLIYLVWCVRAVAPSAVYAKPAMVFICLVIFLNSGFYVVKFDGSWKHQRAMHAAAMKLEELPEDAKVGSWNAGILGYFSSRPVINLDGLVNSDIEEYARTLRLDRYIEENDIRYIADFNRMMTSEIQSVILPESWRTKHLRKIYSIETPEDSWGSGGYSVWKVVADDG